MANTLELIKSLEKIAKKLNASEDAFINYEIRRNTIEGLFYLYRGNGGEVFGKLISCPEIKVNKDSVCEEFISLYGEFEGCYVRMSFALNGK